MKINQPLRARIVPGTQDGSGLRTFTGQVLNASGMPCIKGGFHVEVWVSETQGGLPGGTQTTAWVTGQVLSTVEVNRHWFIITEADGTFSVEVTTAVDDLRSLAGVVHGVADYSEMG